jgi:hypothetical protein
VGVENCVTAFDLHFTARAHIGLSLLGRKALEVPQAQEAHDPADDEDRAGQEEGELETSEE